MRTFYLGAVGLLTVAPFARAECEDLQNLSLPLSGDTTLELSSDAIDCALLEDNEMEEFIIEGGTLTLTGSSTTKFTNLKFTVMDGAGLVFDFDMTEFGPNLKPKLKDSYGGYMVKVMSGASVEFTGEMAATGVNNMRSVFWNDVDGSIEFASNAEFDDCGTNVFRDNYGRLRFYGDVTVTDNDLIGIRNKGGTVRIDGEAFFEKNGGAFGGLSGGGFANQNGGTAIFRGPATFSDNSCELSGGGAYNGLDSKMTFYKKASFYDNSADEDGGGVDNAGGDLKFRGPVIISGNQADYTGGGISTRNGGTTTFYGWTTIQSNTAGDTGGGMSLVGESDSDSDTVVTFRKSGKVLISDNEKTNSPLGCNNIYVDENSELIGYETTDDICDEA